MVPVFNDVYQPNSMILRMFSVTGVVKPDMKKYWRTGCIPNDKFLFLARIK